MKKIMLTVLVAVITLVSVNAQNFGVKAGLNLASITGDFTDGVDGRTSLHIGVVAEFEISDTFSFQPELLYSAQGAKYSENDPGFYSYEEKYKLDYLNIPLMAKFYVAEGFSLEAGPQIGFLLSAKSDWEEWEDGYGSDGGSDDLKDDMSSIDFGLNFGVGYKLDSGLNFGARYNVGLSNINDYVGSDNVNQKNSVLQLSVGYFF